MDLIEQINENILDKNIENFVTPVLKRINGINEVHLGGEELSVIDFVRVKVDRLVSSSLIHTIDNILTSMSINILLLGIEFDIYEIRDIIQSKKKPDLVYLLDFISMKYRGKEDLNDNKYFKSILKSIELIEQNLHFDDKEKFSKKQFRAIDIEEYIYSVVSNIEHNKKLSKKLIIHNGYYIKFELKSYSGDTFNIEPIIINLVADLLHNSIKYSSEGTKIIISIIQTVDNIVISVIDKGYGIEKENINRVFEYGVRLDNTGNQKGAGKGGSKCAYIVNRLGGEIYVKSEIGDGTEIKIILPKLK